jgi:hypothetical protein
MLSTKGRRMPLTYRSKLTAFSGNTWRTIRAAVMTHHASVFWLWTDNAKVCFHYLLFWALIYPLKWKQIYRWKMGAVLKADNLEADKCLACLIRQAELKGVLSWQSNFRVRVRWVRVIKCVLIIAKKRQNIFLKATVLTNKLWTILYILTDILASRCCPCYCYFDRRIYAQHSYCIIE